MSSARAKRRQWDKVSDKRRRQRRGTMGLSKKTKLCISLIAFVAAMISRKTIKAFRKATVSIYIEHWRERKETDLAAHLWCLHSYDVQNRAKLRE